MNNASEPNAGSRAHLQNGARAVPALVLIVDDNQVNLLVMQAMVSKAGYRPLVARSGREGVEAALSQHPALILMDLHMPGMSGPQAAVEIRRRDPSFTAPVLGVTASLTEEQRVACGQAGFATILMKPVDFADLAKKLARLLA